jgi:PAS domain S-box-containing protein
MRRSTRFLHLTNQSHGSRILLPYLILTLGLGFTFLVSYYVSRLADAQDQSRFRMSVQEIDDRIRARLQTSIALLRAGTGLFRASDDVSVSEFRHFVDQIELQKNYPGIQGIGFSQKFNASEKSALIASMQRAGMVDFQVWPDSNRAEYHTIIYLEPADPRNKLAIGFDMFTEPVRRQAMELARDSGSPTASGRVVLVQESATDRKQAGFLIYAPVYRNSAKSDTVESRRQALVGFVYSPFRLDDFLAPVTANENLDVAFQIFDGTRLDSETLLYTSDRLVGRPNSPHFVKNTTQDVAGRTWTLAFETKPSFELGSSRTFLPYTLAAGVLLSLLFFVVTRSEVRARAAAERATLEVLESESTIRKTLSERELAEEALRESEERYRELVENANDIVYVLDFNGQINSINKAAEEITDYSQAELINMNITDILTVDSVAAGKKMLNTDAVGQQRTNYEVEIVSKKGRIVTLEISTRLVYKNAEPVGIQGIARDISSRRRAEEALREADQRALSEYERLVERISGLAQVLGTARELTTIFRGLRDFTRLSVPCDGFFVSLYDQILDVRTACYGWGDDQEIDVSTLPPMPVSSTGPNSRAVRSGQVIITDDYMRATQGHPVVIIGPENGLRPQSSMAVPMAVMGRIIGTIEVQSYSPRAYTHEHVSAMSMAANLTAVSIENVRLLTRESQAREAAEESNRLKDEFLATVSHELRTPLTAILGWSRLLEGGSLEDSVAKQAVETIWRNAKAQAQIVDDILDVSRIITGNLYLDLHPVEIAPVIEAAINVVRPTADVKGIKIDCQLDPLPAVVSGDENRLQQVIWNLLSNAVKFTETGGRVSLELKQVGKVVEIRVADTGQGISRGFLPFVFDRFRQADSTTTRLHGGLGLGLAIARHLVEIHGGTIAAESAGERRGAKFTVRLPLIEAAVTKTRFDQLETGATRVTNQRRQMLSGLRVLLVDDDADTLELMAAALTGRQANVTAVNTAEQAIRAIETSRPDVLVSDIAMPEEDGYGLISRVRSLEDNEARTIPAVAITAYAKEEDRLRVLSAGYQIYLAKPVELTELVSVVAKAARGEF